jgi:hypothetical protein
VCGLWRELFAKVGHRTHDHAWPWLHESVCVYICKLAHSRQATRGRSQLAVRLCSARGTNARRCSAGGRLSSKRTAEAGPSGEAVVSIDQAWWVRGSVGGSIMSFALTRASAVGTRISYLRLSCRLWTSESGTTAARQKLRVIAFPRRHLTPLLQSRDCVGLVGPITVGTHGFRKVLLSPSLYRPVVSDQSAPRLLLV